MNISDTFNQFFNQYNGQLVEAEDPSNPYQCFDLAFKWCDAIGVDRSTIRHPNAFQIWTNPLDLTIAKFEMIPNTPNGIPQVGDIVVFSTTIGPAGHVSIAKGVGSINSFDSFDQNWGTVKNSHTITHSYTGVLGWLRLRQVVDTSALQNQINALQSKIDKAKADLA